MKWIKWIVFVGAFMAMLYYTAVPDGFVTNPGDDGDGIAGTYSINGLGPTGVEYTGVFMIASVNDDGTYPVQWIVTGAIDEGVGRLDGSAFEVQWVSKVTSGDPMSGTATYVLQPDGRLVGERWVDGFDAPSTEEIFPQA